MSKEIQIDKIADYLKQIKKDYTPIEIKVSDVLENAKYDEKYYITDFREKNGRTRFCIVDEKEYARLTECRKECYVYDDIDLRSYFWFNKGYVNTKKDRRDFAKRFIRNLEMHNKMMEE